MRKINSEFQTKYLSSEGQKLTNRDYFGYVEMDDFACYILADSLEEDDNSISAKYVVDSIIRSFVEKPTLSKGMLRSYLHKAHKELLKERRGMRLKASVVMVVTDYQKMRYIYAGNSRFYLIRNNRILFQSKDQSLTRNMIDQQKVPLDQAAVHEERNNLYSYLGERGKPEIMISPKIKMEDGDILAQLTRGAWENCTEEELLRSVEASTEPKEILDSLEDCILSRQGQEKEIDNFSAVVTLVGKVFISPEKKITLKKVLTVAIPVIMMIGIIAIVLFLQYQDTRNKEYQLIQYMESAETYLRYDNYKKASEEYAEARKIANDLKRSEDIAETDMYLKLADQILLADEAILSEEYIKAQELYLAARELSINAGNVGKKYINLQLNQTRDYIEVHDWISVGEIKEDYGDLEGAIEAYRQAKEKASALYAKDLKEEALNKQTTAEEKLTEERKAVKAEEEAARQEILAAAEKEKEVLAAALELENLQKANDQKNAIELENQGNELLAEGKYDSAITFYRTAQAIYYRLELADLGDNIESKIKAAQAGSTAKNIPAEDGE